MRLTVRVTPKGGRDAIDGWGVDASGLSFLRVRVRVARKAEPPMRPSRRW